MANYERLYKEKCSENVKLRAENEKLSAENAELRAENEKLRASTSIVVSVVCMCALF